jgi:TPR repeat protein
MGKLSKKVVYLIIGLIVFSAVALVALRFFKWPESQSSTTAQQGTINIPDLQARASQGDAQAQYALGRAFVDGNGVTRDFKQAANWLQMAAQQGHPEAAATLGELYQAGQGVPKDLPSALKWYHAAGDKGSVAAQYDLGFLYEKGQGMPRDAKQAAHWFLLAAQGGDPLAQFDYGQRCEQGIGVDKNLIEALKWLTLAAAGGQADAAAAVPHVRQSMTAEEISQASRAIAAFVPRKP